MQRYLQKITEECGKDVSIFDLLGGHVDENEDLFTAMIREAKEEVGIDILRENMKVVHIYHQLNIENGAFYSCDE